MLEYCTSEQERAALLDEVAEQLEVEVKTLKNYVSIAKKFSPGFRAEYPRLEMGHYDAVSGINMDDAWALLERAQLEGWSVAKLRMEVNVLKGKVVDMDEITQRRYAVLSKLTYAGLDAEATSKSLKFWLGGDLIEISSSTDLDWRVS